MVLAILEFTVADGEHQRKLPWCFFSVIEYLTGFKNKEKKKKKEIYLWQSPSKACFILNS